MKINPNVALALVLTVIFGGALALATGFPSGAKVFPYLIGGMGLALALGAVAVELRASRAAQASENGITRSDEDNNGESRRREISTALWIVGFFAGIGLAGFQWGLPVVVVLYYAIECRLRLVTAILMGLVAAGFIYAAVTYLNVPLYAGFPFTR